ncbi:MAG TPA: hypothetical protein VLN57_19550 [Xanthobacteraceae bacterium]|nr:hypothetical protein [Xanthobacteraceae bacterium]
MTETNQSEPQITSKNALKHLSRGTTAARASRSRPAGLHVWARKDTGGFQIVGTINGQRIRRRAQSADLEHAQQECRRLEAELLELDPIKTRLTEIEKRLGKIEWLLEQLIERSK